MMESGWVALEIIDLIYLYISPVSFFFFSFFFPPGCKMLFSEPPSPPVPTSPSLPFQGRGRCILSWASVSASLAPLASSRRNGAPCTPINVLYYISDPAKAARVCLPRSPAPPPACTLSTALGGKILEQMLRPPASPEPAKAPLLGVLKRVSSHDVGYRIFYQQTSIRKKKKFKLHRAANGEGAGGGRRKSEAGGAGAGAGTAGDS